MVADQAFLVKVVSGLMTVLAPALVAFNLTSAAATAGAGQEVQQQVRAHVDDRLLRGVERVLEGQDEAARQRKAEKEEAAARTRAMEKQLASFGQRLEQMEACQRGVILSPYENQSRASNGR